MLTDLKPRNVAEKYEEKEKSFSKRNQEFSHHKSSPDHRNDIVSSIQYDSSVFASKSLGYVESSNQYSKSDIKEYTDKPISGMSAVLSERSISNPLGEPQLTEPDKEGKQRDKKKWLRIIMTVWMSIAAFIMVTGCILGAFAAATTGSGMYIVIPTFTALSWVILGVGTPTAVIMFIMALKGIWKGIWQ